jgi:hypothetical protein
VCVSVSYDSTTVAPMPSHVCMCVRTHATVGSLRCTGCDSATEKYVYTNRSKFDNVFWLRCYGNLQLHIQEGNDRTVPISLNKLLEGM